MKRSTWPSDPAVARQGGFEVQGSVPDKAVMFRSAAASHVLLMMENVLALCRYCISDLTDIQWKPLMSQQNR